VVSSTVARQRDLSIGCRDESSLAERGSRGFEAAQ